MHRISLRHERSPHKNQSAFNDNARQTQIKRNNRKKKQQSHAGVDANARQPKKNVHDPKRNPYQRCAIAHDLIAV